MTHGGEEATGGVLAGVLGTGAGLDAGGVDGCGPGCGEDRAGEGCAPWPPLPVVAWGGDGDCSATRWAPLPGCGVTAGGAW